MDSPKAASLFAAQRSRGLLSLQDMSHAAVLAARASPTCTTSSRLDASVTPDDSSSAFESFVRFSATHQIPVFPISHSIVALHIYSWTGAAVEREIEMINDCRMVTEFIWEGLEGCEEAMEPVMANVGLRGWIEGKGSGKKGRTYGKGTSKLRSGAVDGGNGTTAGTREVTASTKSAAVLSPSVSGARSATTTPSSRMTTRQTTRRQSSMTPTPLPPPVISFSPPPLPSLHLLPSPPANAQRKRQFKPDPPSDQDEELPVAKRTKQVGTKPTSRRGAGRGSHLRGVARRKQKNVIPLAESVIGIELETSATEKDSFKTATAVQEELEGLPKEPMEEVDEEKPADEIGTLAVVEAEEPPTEWGIFGPIKRWFGWRA